VIRLEAGGAGRVRVIGSLQGPELQSLLDSICRDPVVLDLSEVDQADESAVKLLAGLPEDRCTLARCPRWLALWVDRLRQAATAHR
jgi:hypothetical protein